MVEGSLDSSTCDMVAVPHFESLPLETCNVRYISVRPNRTIFTWQPIGSWPFSCIDEIAIDLGSMRLNGGSIIDAPIFGQKANLDIGATGPIDHPFPSNGQNQNRPAYQVQYTLRGAGYSLPRYPLGFNRMESKRTNLAGSIQDAAGKTVLSRPSTVASPRQQVYGTNPTIQQRMRSPSGIGASAKTPESHFTDSGIFSICFVTKRLKRQAWRRYIKPICHQPNVSLHKL